MTSEATAEYARKLERQARADPSSVAVDELLGLLSEPSATVRRIGLEGLQSAVTDSSVDPAPVAPRVRDQVTDDDQLVRNAAVTVLGKIALREPELVVPMVDDLRQCLREECLERPAALNVLGTLSREAPAAVRPAVPELLSCLESGGEPERQEALYCLGSIALEYPEAVAEGVGVFVDLFTEPNTSVGISTFGMESEMDVERTRAAVSNAVSERRNRRAVAGQILLEIAHDDPEVVTPELDAIAGQLDDDDPQVKSAVLDVFEGIAREQPAALDAYHSRVASCLEASPIVRASALNALDTIAETGDASLGDTLEPHADTLVALLDDDDARTRTRAVALLAEVAEDLPGAVANATDQVRALLGDDAPSVRRTVVQFLAVAGDESDTATLVELSESDPDADVRTAARDVTPRR